MTTYSRRGSRSVAEGTRAGTAHAVRQSKPPKPPKPMTGPHRNTLATQGIVSMLAATDEKSALTAALEAVNERLAWDAEFRRSLRQKYEEIAALDVSKPTTERGPAPTPRVGQGTRRATGYGKIDPYQLLDEFGADQLRAALGSATRQALLDAVAIVQAHEPNSKPTSKKTNQDMTDFIVEHVAGSGH
jgi:hypothetical protein